GRVRGRGRRGLGLFGPGDLALREVEDLREELPQAVGRERPAVRAQQVVEHPLLALEVDELETSVLLVALQARDELQACVDRLYDGTVRVRDLLSELADEGVRSRRRRSRRRSWSGRDTARSTSGRARSRGSPGR